MVDGKYLPNNEMNEAYLVDDDLRGADRTFTAVLVRSKVFVVDSVGHCDEDKLLLQRVRSGEHSSSAWYAFIRRAVVRTRHVD